MLDLTCQNPKHNNATILIMHLMTSCGILIGLGGGGRVVLTSLRFRGQVNGNLPAGTSWGDAAVSVLKRASPTLCPGRKHCNMAVIRGLCFNHSICIGAPVNNNTTIGADAEKRF